MPITASFTTRFNKDIKRVKKRHKDLSKLKKIIDSLINQQPLSKSHKDHILIGNYAGANKSLSEEGNPRFDTINKIINALGCKLEIV